MIRGLLLTLAYLAFLGLGTSAPFVLVLGYAWIDGASPHLMSYGSGLLPLIPVSLIMGVGAVAAYFLMDRRDPPRFNLGICLIIALAIWSTITTATIAEVPDAAWSKWNTAFKTLVFCAFLPYAIRTRVQIEAFLQVFLFSTALFFIPVGLKTMVSGGGYGQALSVINTNSGLSEGGNLASVSLMMIPVMFYLAEHSMLIDFRRIRRIGYGGLSLVAVAAAIGTYERTALVGLVVVGAFMWLKSRHKIFFTVFVAVVATAIVYLTSSAWTARISTINDYNQESSALGRILVWRWTLDFVSRHPLGGGFNVFYIDHIFFPDGTEVVGKAFHSIYFEVLGEQGIVGILLWGGMLGYALVSLQQVMRSTRKTPEMRWASDLSAALQAALLTMLACGAFIGVAFQPFINYIVAMAICLRENLRRTQYADGDSVAKPKTWRLANVSKPQASSLAPTPKQLPTASHPGSPTSWRDRTSNDSRGFRRG